MNIRMILLSGIMAYLFGVVLFEGAGTALAAHHRVHSSQCHYYYDNAGTDVYNGAYLSSETIGHGIYCPAPSDSELSHAATTTLNVHGYSPSATSAYSEACVKTFNTTAYTCGTLKYWAAGTDGVHNIDVSEWAAEGAGMPVVYSYLPPGSMLYGFYMAN